jgi:uncharacterized protein YfiM (DUF2279 family)
VKFYDAIKKFAEEWASRYEGRSWSNL